MSGEFDMGAQLAGQVPPEVAPGPPQTPEEFQQRKSAWSNVLDRINSDPNMQMMILRMGTRLMQPIAPGQTRGGHFAGALEDSVDYLGGLREAERTRQNQERKLSLDERKGAADIEHSGAVTASTRQATEQKGQTFPDVMQENKAKLEKLNLELVALRVVNTPEMVKKRRQLEMEKLQLENDLKKAQTGLAQSHSRAYDSMSDRGDKTQTHVSSDGTTTTTIKRGKESYIVRNIPAEVPDEIAARARAKSEAKRLGGGWFGKAEYTGTEQEFVDKRTKELMSPKVEYFDLTGRKVDKLPEEPGGPVQPNTPTKQLSTRDKGLQSSVAVRPGEIVDPHSDVDTLAADLVDINGKIKKAKQGSPEMAGLLDARKEIQAKLSATKATGTNELVQTSGGPAINAPAGPTKLVRGPDGTVQVAGSSSPVAAPSTAPSEAEVNAMITNAAKGYQPAREYLQRVLASGELNMRQRQRVEEALRRGQQ